jgi:hypothetical protein
MAGLDANVVSPIRVDRGKNPLTCLALADENTSAIHPLPQRGEGKKFNAPLAPLGDRKAEADSRGDILPAKDGRKKVLTSKATIYMKTQRCMTK